MRSLSQSKLNHQCVLPLREEFRGEEAGVQMAGIALLSSWATSESWPSGFSLSNLRAAQLENQAQHKSLFLENKFVTELEVCPWVEKLPQNERQEEASFSNRQSDSRAM